MKGCLEIFRYIDEDDEKREYNILFKCGTKTIYDATLTPIGSFPEEHYCEDCVNDATGEEVKEK